MLCTGSSGGVAASTSCCPGSAVPVSVHLVLVMITCIDAAGPGAAPPSASTVEASLRSSLLVLLLLAACPTEGLLRCDGACGRRGSSGGGAATGTAAAVLHRLSSSVQSARRPHAAADLGSGSAGELGRAVVLHTQFGDIRVRLLERQAPTVTRLVWEMAAARNCTTAYNCAFYRRGA